MTGAPRLILASSSPQRRDLLAQLGVAFDVSPSPLPEPSRRPPAVGPRAWAAALAYFKARSVADAWPERWVLGADTIVWCAGELLGKPRDRADAQRMLELQASEPGDVVTGIALVRDGAAVERWISVETTRVWMHNSVERRAAYLDSGDWAGKAGAYGIQTVGDALVARIEGSFSNVVGLPLERLSRLMPAAALG